MRSEQNLQYQSTLKTTTIIPRPGPVSACWLYSTGRRELIHPKFWNQFHVFRWKKRNWFPPIVGSINCTVSYMYIFLCVQQNIWIRLRECSGIAKLFLGHTKDSWLYLDFKCANVCYKIQWWTWLRMWLWNGIIWNWILWRCQGWRWWVTFAAKTEVDEYRSDIGS